MQTIWFRALETMFGLMDFGTPIDTRSFGVVLLESCRVASHESIKDKATYMEAFGPILGSPAASVVASWPKPPRKGSVSLLRSLPDLVYESAGSSGADLLVMLLAWDPAGRPRAADVTKHPFTECNRLTCTGQPSTAPTLLSPRSSGQPAVIFGGARHPWSLISGVTSTEVLNF